MTELDALYVTKLAKAKAEQKAANAKESRGGKAGSGGGSYCNPGDWFCNDLTLGPGPVQGGAPKWAFHEVVLRDDAEAYRHYTGGNWGGITAPMRRDMELFAQ